MSFKKINVITYKEIIIYHFISGKFYKMDARAEKGQTGLHYSQKILIQVAGYFLQKTQLNICCNQTFKLLYTLAKM